MTNNLDEDWLQCFKQASYKRIKRMGKKLIRSLADFLGSQSTVGNTPVLDSKHFPFLESFAGNWLVIRAEAVEILKHREAIPVFHEISPDH